MKNKFLNKVAKHIQLNYSKLHDLIIILPSIRARKFLSKELFEVYGRPILSPRILTIDEWIKINSMPIIDNTRSLLLLYKIHESIEKKPESFDEFAQWGRTLLSDFDDINKYLLNSSDVFKNLRSIKDLEAWKIDKTISIKQQKFLSFWDTLDKYYFEFHERLRALGFTTMSLALKELSEKNIATIKDEKYLFVGFNALSKSEQTIISKLLNAGVAEYFFDADDYYMNDNIHEAGTFIRKIKQELNLNSPMFIEDNLGRKNLEIDIYNCPQKTGQVKIASDFISKLNDEELNHTAIILADEKLISSLIENIPNNVKDVNITLGLTLDQTSVKNWVDLIFSIQENKSNFRTEAIYFNDLIKLFHHPFILSLLTTAEKESISEIERDIVGKNKVFLTLKNLILPNSLHNILIELLENWSNDWSAAMKRIRQINKLLFNLIQDHNKYELSCILTFENSLVSFQQIVEEGLPKINLKSFKSLFSIHWKTAKLTYEGSPTKGLQIMGILESRLLDFKNIIILGFNEGNLPSINPINSIIPIDLRHGFGLPTPREKQGVFAHHFYRLLHYADHVICTYLSSSDKLGSNEMSRYLLQIEYELSKENENLKLNKHLYSIPTSTIHNQNTQVTKSEFLITQIKHFFNTPISASAINKYLACPLDFYYRYIVQFEEENQVDEQIETNNFGTFIHQTLETLYRPFAQHDKEGNKVFPSPPSLNSNHISKMIIDFPEILKTEFINFFGGEQLLIQKGRNKLSFDMAILITKKFLEEEQKFILSLKEPLYIEYLEIEMKSNFKISINNQKLPVSIRGFIDRIDRIGKNYRIIDYKSGKSNERDVVFNKTNKSTIFSVFKNSKHTLQLAFYSLLFESTFGFQANEVLVKTLLRPNKEYCLVNKNGSISDLNEEVKKLLSEIYIELVEPKSYIEHSTENKYCQFCE